MYYTQEQIDRANQADLVSFLQSQGEQLTRAGNEYRWKRHDSLTVRGNKWYRHSQSKGGAPIDFVMEFFACQQFNGFGEALAEKLHDKINGCAAFALAVAIPFVSPDSQAVVPFPAVFLSGADKLLSL